MDLERNGRPEFSRPRKLYETEFQTVEHFTDKLLEQVVDERGEATDELFTDLAKTFLKGRALQKGLSKMDPAQFIIIEEFADTVRAGATRLSAEESKNGSIITYSLFQKCVDIVLAKKWNLRLNYISMKIPASVEQQSREAVKQASNGSGVDSLIEEFIAQNGIAATIIGMLTVSPFQTIIFQGLTSEQSVAKGIQMAQIPIGIALFLELGIKAERIYKILKTANVGTPIVEQQVARLSESQTARAEAFEQAGIDYDEFRASQEVQDSQNIIDYVTQYYARYGGLDKPKGHLTIDHWVAYLHVAQNQQTIRGALNNADLFSPKFKDYKDHYNRLPSSQEEPETIFTEKNKKHSNISIQLASATKALRESSNDIYDDILNSFVYQLTDQDMCCLVQIFGALGNPTIMYSLASLLRILAADLSSEILRIQNLMCSFLANIFQDALFELIGQINSLYEKIVKKLTKAFTINFDNIEACSGMLSLGWALTHSVRVLFDQIKTLMKEISSIIGDFGTSKSGSWKISADRRHLLGTARLLEVLAARLDLANKCAISNKKKLASVSSQISDTNNNIDQALFSILESRPPTLEISEEDKQKFFSDTPKMTSSNLKFNYGMSSEQNNEGDTSKCQEGNNEEKLNKLVENLNTAISTTFNG